MLTIFLSLLEKIGLVKELFNDKTTEGLARYENIQELLNSIKEWVDTKQALSQIDEDGILVDPDPEMQIANQPASVSGAAGLASYLQEITLLTDADEKD